MPRETDIVLVTENYGGNLHETAGSINRQGLADLVLSMHGISGTGSIVVYRVTREQAKELFGRDM